MPALFMPEIFGFASTLQQIFVYLWRDLHENKMMPNPECGFHNATPFKNKNFERREGGERQSRIIGYLK